MGLDMNLFRKSYVKNWEHQTPDQKHMITIAKGGKARADIETEKIAYVIEEVAYWRKQNAIHNWIVKNCANGVDKCQEIYVSDENIKKLLTIVNTVLSGSKLKEDMVKNGTSYENGKATINWEKGKTIADKTMAEMLLPTAEGFFFGSTDYDEWYYEGLVETKEVLEKAIEKGGDYYYQASW
jgi:hypothetical protein